MTPSMNPPEASHGDAAGDLHPVSDRPEISSSPRLFPVASRVGHTALKPKTVKLPYLSLRRRADAYHDLVLARIRKLCAQAGVPDHTPTRDVLAILRAPDFCSTEGTEASKKLHLSARLARARLWATRDVLATLQAAECYSTEEIEAAKKIQFAARLARSRLWAAHLIVLRLVLRNRVEL